MYSSSSQIVELFPTAPTTPALSVVPPPPVRPEPLLRKCQFAPEGQPMSVTVVHTAAELAAHVPAWDALAADAVEPNVFYESWMLLPALEAFGQQAGLRVVLVYTTGPSNEGSKPILCGLFPLAAQRGFKGLPVRYSSLWRYKYCSLCTPLLHPTYAADCLKAFLDWVEQDSKVGLFLEMPYVGGDGPLNQLLVNRANDSRNLLMIEDRSNRALLEPVETGAEAGERYINTALSGKRRKELRRQEKLLREQGKLEFVELAPGEATDRWCEQFLELEAQGWKGQEGSALGSQTAAKTFFLTAMRDAAQRGQLMMLALHLNGKPLAMKCNLLSGAGSFSFKIAFDESYASHSPGVHLELENIRRVHERAALPGATLRWMDSCATANHFMINRLWLSRRTIKTVLVATNKRSGNFLVALTPLLRWFKRTFFNHVVLHH